MISEIMLRHNFVTTMTSYFILGFSNSQRKNSEQYWQVLHLKQVKVFLDDNQLISDELWEASFK